MQLIVPFTEVLEIARGLKPFPPELEAVWAEGGTVFLKVNPREHLPELLRRFTPNLTLTVRYRNYQAGVARFEIGVNLARFSATELINLVLKVFALPRQPWYRVEAGEGGAGAQLLVDVPGLLAPHIRGLSIEEFYFMDGEFIVLGKLENFGLVTAEALPERSSP